MISSLKLSLAFDNFVSKSNIFPIISVAGTIFAYFSILIVSFGDYSRYLSNEKELNKGNLSIGNDADFCILDINKPWIVKKENLISKSKNTSIEGRKLQGKITNTFVKGEELFKN